MKLSNIACALSGAALFWGVCALHVDISRLKVTLDIPDEPSTDRSMRTGNVESRPVREPDTLRNAGQAQSLEETEYKVELDYEDHLGFPTEDGKYIKFSNIPYAQPPNTSDTRFLPPFYFFSDERQTNDGSNDHICPQLIAGWFPPAAQFVNDTLTKPVLPDKWETPISVEDYPKFKPQPDLDSRSSEDCLLLDVVVPKQVWDQRNDRRVVSPATIVWIHGGGFIFGSKNDIRTPEGLLNAVNETDDQIIHVSINYRLGAFGFLGGSDYMKDAPANIGLLDQRFALDWVASYINLFGGSRDRMAAMGQSAGASSILHHIVSYGGARTPPPFKTAILQSPGFFPQPNNTVDNLTYKEFLTRAGAKDIEALAQVDTKILMQANADMTFNSSYGIFRFGPTVDDSYIPDLPSKLLRDGNNHKNLKILVGHTKFDGLIFTPPWIRSNGQLAEHVRSLYPGVPSEVLSKVEQEYPIESISYAKEKVLRVANFLDDISIQCNSHYLSKRVAKEPRGLVYRYVYNIVPAIHGADVPYSYYPALDSIPPVNAAAAHRWQRAVVNFARYWDPNEEDVQTWQPYVHDDPPKKKVMNFGAADQIMIPNYSTSIGDDLLNQELCDYWQSAPYYVEPGKRDGGERSDSAANQVVMEL